MYVQQYTISSCGVYQWWYTRIISLVYLSYGFKTDKQTG